MERDGQIGSVRKALEILRQISDAENGVIGLKELAERTGVPKSTCVHLLNTLCDGGFVQRRTARGAYSLGPMSYYITRNGKYEKKLVRLCHPVMSWLRKKTGQTIILSVLHEGDKYIVHYVTGERPLNDEGNILLGHVYETATGRAMIANLRADERKAILKRNGIPSEEQWKEACTPEKLEAALESVREQGYAIADMPLGDRRDIGIGGVIRNSDGVVGAIGIAVHYLPAGEQLPEGEMEEYILQLKRALREINHRLSFEEVRPEDVKPTEP